MSDRISIDHIHNTITIQVRTQDLSDMTNEQILIWIRAFIHNIETAPFQIGIIGETNIIPPNHIISE